MIKEYRINKGGKPEEFIYIFETKYRDTKLGIRTNIQCTNEELDEMDKSAPESIEFAQDFLKDVWDPATGQHAGQRWYAESDYYENNAISDSKCRIIDFGQVSLPNEVSPDFNPLEALYD